MSSLQSTEGTPDEELAILIHGTFAGSDADSGDKWWQDDSPVVRELAEKLPDRVRIAEGDEVFHWSGENGERARSKAAAKLLRHLRPLDEAGKSYHLVGHSHGGSVIWMALRMSLLAGKPLKGLKSWTTIGTPFLHQSSRRPWHPLNILAVVVGLVLLRPAFTAAKDLVVLLWDAASGHPIAMTLKSDAEAGPFAILRAPFIALVEWLGVAVERSEAGIHLGSFDPAGDVSLVEYLFLSREGLVLLGVLILCLYFFLHLAALTLRPVIESVRVQAEKRLQKQAFEEYGATWLGLWSDDDEAINGLRATLDLSTKFVKRMAPSDRVFLTDHLELLSRPYYWILGPIFNRLLRPIIDSFVRGILVRSAQGNDRPTTRVVDVRPVPVEQAGNAPALPEPLQKKILDESNRHAEIIAPLLRDLLGSPSFTSGLEAFSDRLSGHELVHTSYFFHSDVLDLISCNICWEGTQAFQSPATLPGSRTIVDWFVSFKQSITVTGASSLLISSALSSKESIPPTPKRRAG